MTGHFSWRLLKEKGKYETEVIKDAAATALYGARGANGVVVIKMKQQE